MNDCTSKLLKHVHLIYQEGRDLRDNFLGAMKQLLIFHVLSLFILSSQAVTIAKFKALVLPASVQSEAASRAMSHSRSLPTEGLGRWHVTQEWLTLPHGKCTGGPSPRRWWAGSERQLSLGLFPPWWLALVRHTVTQFSFPSRTSEEPSICLSHRQGLWRRCLDWGGRRGLAGWARSQSKGALGLGHGPLWPHGNVGAVARSSDF